MGVGAAKVNPVAATTDDSRRLRPRLTPRLTVSLALSTLELTRSTVLLLLLDDDDEEDDAAFFLLDPEAELLLRADRGATGASSSSASASSASAFVALFFALPLLALFFALPVLLLFLVDPARLGARSGWRDDERVTRDGVPDMTRKRNGDCRTEQ